MRRFLTLLLCVSFCVQPVLAADTGQEKQLSLQEEMKQEDTGEESANAETEDEDTASTAEAGEETTSDAETAKAGSETSEGVDVSAPSALLMEASTGQVIYEKDADSKRPPASVTKIMTLLLIFDALEAGKINLEDEVTTSEYAASMGGSQVFLEPGEVQTVDTMIKCISVASANDACVSFQNDTQAFVLYRKN